jgi:hypothetical protein
MSSGHSQPEERQTGCLAGNVVKLSEDRSPSASEVSHFYNGRVAQLVEQRTENPRVGGSIPLPATIFSGSTFR